MDGKYPSNSSSPLPPSKSPMRSVSALQRSPVLPSRASGSDVDLSNEDRYLLWLKDNENLPWKDIALKFHQGHGTALQVAALQMRYKRLREKLEIQALEQAQTRGDAPLPPLPTPRATQSQYPPPIIIAPLASDNTDIQEDAFERDYVLIEKRAVEVNALPSEDRRGIINSSPSRPVSSMSIPSIAEADAMPPTVDDTSTSGATVLEHNVYQVESEIPFQHLKVLGRGTFGIVESVKCTSGPLQGRIFASKIIISRQLDSPGFTERIKSEVEIIHRLRHRHLVTIRRTYRWKHQFCMIMEPVADMDLETFLHDLDETEPSKRNDGLLALLVRWYGCLTDVLAYLFTQKIRHKDIKPPNILVKGSNVFLTDFGVAKDLMDSTSTATWGRAGTPMYAAPEVASMERHGRLADLFAMGAIFLEFCTILAGYTLAEFKEFRGPPGEQSYAENTGATLKWMVHLGHEASKVVDAESKSLLHALLWLCSRMLQPEPEKRIGSIALRHLISRVSLYSKNSSDVWILGCTSCYPEFDEENCGISRATLAENFRTSLDKLAVEEPLSEDCSLTWDNANTAGFDSLLPESSRSKSPADSVLDPPETEWYRLKELAEKYGDYNTLLSVIGQNYSRILLGKYFAISAIETRAGLADFIEKLVIHTGLKAQIVIDDSFSKSKSFSLYQDLLVCRPEYFLAEENLALQSDAPESSFFAQSDPVNLVILDSVNWRRGDYLKTPYPNPVATISFTPISGGQDTTTKISLAFDALPKKVENLMRTVEGTKHDGTISLLDCIDGDFFSYQIPYTYFSLAPYTMNMPSDITSFDQINSSEHGSRDVTSATAASVNSSRKEGLSRLNQHTEYPMVAENTYSTSLDLVSHQTLQQSNRNTADEILMLRYKNSLLERMLVEKGDTSSQLGPSPEAGTKPPPINQNTTSTQANDSPVQDEQPRTPFVVSPDCEELLRHLDGERTIYMVDLYDGKGSSVDDLKPGWSSNLADIAASTVLARQKDVLMYMARPGTDAKRVLRGLAPEHLRIRHIEFDNLFTDTDLTYIPHPPSQRRVETRVDFVVLLDSARADYWKASLGEGWIDAFNWYINRLADVPPDAVEAAIRFKVPDMKTNGYTVDASGFWKRAAKKRKCGVKRRISDTVPWFRGGAAHSESIHCMCFKVEVECPKDGVDSAPSQALPEAQIDGLDHFFPNVDIDKAYATLMDPSYGDTPVSVDNGLRADWSMGQQRQITKWSETGK